VSDTVRLGWLVGILLGRKVGKILVGDGVGMEVVGWGDSMTVGNIIGWEELPLLGDVVGILVFVGSCVVG